MSGYNPRQEDGQPLCLLVDLVAAAISSKELDRWDRVWEFVDGPKAEFMLPVTSWEMDATEKAALDVCNAGIVLCDAWRRASAAFLAETTGA